MSWKVLILSDAINAAPGRARAILREAGCTLIDAPKPGPVSAAALLAQLDGFDAVLASTDQYNADVLRSSQARALKIISRWGVGYDAIDVAAATENGIVIAYTPGLLDNAVADYAMTLLCGFARRLHEGYLSLMQGRWAPAWGTDIGGGTLGLVGCGRIGQAVAKRARGFEMRLLAHDIAPSPEAEKLGVEFVPLDELLARSDFVSLHVALTPTTRGLIGEAQLRKMKRTACLINTARGAVIDEAALTRALHEKWIAGAALDAFAVEPLAPDHPFLTTPNLLITPHQASMGIATGERVSDTAAQAIADLKSGRAPQFVVNPDVLDSPALRASIL